MKLLISTGSPFARKCRIVAREVGLDVDEVIAPPLDPGAAETSPNPLGMIPALVLDDGTALYDSRVIAEWMDAHGNGGLFPDGASRFDALRAQALADGAMDAVVKLHFERMRPEAERSDYWRDRWLGAVLRALDAVELREGWDIGHVATACLLGYLDLRRPDIDWRTRRPDLAEWFAKASERSSLKATHPK